MACSEADYEKLTQGAKIKVTGYKGEWAGEVEIMDATFELMDGSYVAEAVDATAWLGTDELINQTYNFCVESYLCDNTTDVYNAVEALNIGDTVDMEGFLYWYEGANPHVTSITVK